MKTLFRILVFISTVLSLLLWILPVVDNIWYTEAELEFLSYDSYGSIIPRSPYIYWGLLVAWSVNAAGLFFFIKFARVSFIILHALVFVFTFFWGIRVLTPEIFALGELLSLIDGSIIAIAYLTSISGLFEAPQSQSPNKAQGVT